MYVRVRVCACTYITRVCTLLYTCVRTLLYTCAYIIYNTCVRAYIIYIVLHENRLLIKVNDIYSLPISIVCIKLFIIFVSSIQYNIYSSIR